MAKRFQYTANVEGKYVKDVVEAPDLRTARTMMRDQGLFPITLEEVSELQSLIESTQKGINKAIEETKAKGAKKKGRKKADEDEPAKKIERPYLFKYKALHQATKEEVEGHIVETDIRKARIALREQNMIPIDVQRERKVKSENETEDSFFTSFIDRLAPPKVPLKELVLFAQQLAAMIEAGLALTQALEILIQSTNDRILRKNVREILAEIIEGRSFADSLRTRSYIFPKIFAELVSLGEETGNLDQNLKRLADYLTADLELRAKIKSALTYPKVVGFILIMMVTGIMIFIVPTFIALFEDFKIKIPLLTQMLIDLSNLIRYDWLKLILGIVIGMAVYKNVIKTKGFKWLWYRVEYKIKMVGDLLLKIALSKILHNLSIALKAGLTITRAMDNSLEGISNDILREKLKIASLQIQSGARLSTCFEQMEMFPKLVIQLVSAGEATGNIDEMLGRAAGYIDNEINTTVDNLTAFIEPIMTLCLGGAVMFIVGALYYPLIQLMSGPKGGV